ncbi:hypothetical protein H4219_001701 [Mycoemilia scoparia]|uniref:Uncharacterized protein n=1 Tax=Mycoemilia scoparia TaxID=417184 RepID=A0A9W7ZZL7_9FUNG|nr:hypothetical protein H4219_001701 [Mycoemilia scoparia]
MSALRVATRLPAFRSQTTITFARRFATTAKTSSEKSTASAAAEAVPKKRRAIGGFRGGVVGFLLGATTAGAAGFLYLIDQYQKTSSLVLESIDDLEATSRKVKDYVRKIESVESDLNKVQYNVATKEQLLQLKADWRKQVDILSREHLELKAHVWEIGRFIS